MLSLDKCPLNPWKWSFRQTHSRHPQLPHLHNLWGTPTTRSVSLGRLTLYACAMFVINSGCLVLCAAAHFDEALLLSAVHEPRTVASTAVIQGITLCQNTMDYVIVASAACFGALVVKLVSIPELT